MPIIPVLRRLTQENSKFKVSLGYIMRPYLKKKLISSLNLKPPFLLI
jgi:hypothetical protein